MDPRSPHREYQGSSMGPVPGRSPAFSRSTGSPFQRGDGSYIGRDGAADGYSGEDASAGYPDASGEQSALERTLSSVSISRGSSRPAQNGFGRGGDFLGFNGRVGGRGDPSTAPFSSARGRGQVCHLPDRIAGPGAPTPTHVCAPCCSSMHPPLLLSNQKFSDVMAMELAGIGL